MKNLMRGLLLMCLVVGVVQTASAADVRIRNLDAGTDRGLSSSDTVDPIDGNEGTTLGEQRRIALLYAIRVVASRIDSAVPIQIDASVDPENSDLKCSRNAATLGLGGATNFTANFPGAPQRNVLYPIALANALAGRRLFADADVRLVLNGKLDAGDVDCLRGTRWYYGLEGDPDRGEVDFVSTVVHEIIHGLGFQSLVAMQDRDDAKLGAFPEYRDGERIPDVFSTYIQDLSLTGEPRWPQLNRRQRADSMNNRPFVVWSSATTNSSTTNYLTAGRQDGQIRIFAPETIRPGSSISHWSAALSPNQIMEPFEAPDSNVFDGLGLAACALRDLGWDLQSGVRCPDTDTSPLVGSARGVFVDSYPASTDEDTPSASADDGDDDGGGSGGGCTLAPGQPLDPLWAMMCLLAIGVLINRRRSARIG